MSDFNKAFKFTIKNEGGFTNDPADSGGPTNWGITLGDFSRYLGRPASIKEVQEMSLETAKAIYYKMYWLPLGLPDVVNDNVATVIFDQGVLRGIFGITKIIQSIIGVKVDGHIGPLTLMAINSQDPNELIKKIEAQGEFFYTNLASRVPKNKRFLSGWLNRARRLLSLLTK